MPIRAAIFGLALLLALVASGGRGAVAAVTVGSDLAASSGSRPCADASGSCTVEQSRLPNPSALNVPLLGTSYPGNQNGVIVRWRVRDAAGPLRLRVLRMGPAGSAVVASGPTVTAPGPGVHVFAARIPVAYRDSLAVDVLGGSLGYREYAPPPPGESVVARALEWSPPLDDGAIVRASTRRDNLEALFNAEIEPDDDGDGYGDVTQDQCPRDGKLQGSCAADLAVTVNSGRASAGFGVRVYYGFTVTNLGSSPADSVLVTVSPPLGALWDQGFQCAITVAFTGCNTRGARLAVSIATLAAGASAGVIVRGVAAGTGSIVVPATVTASTADPQLSNNAVSVKTAVKLRRGACSNVLTGSLRPDVLTGTPAGDRLSGGLGADTLRGKAGDDCLNGGGGADRIDGGTGKDRITGGSGKDTLLGGSGDDTIDAKDGFVDKVNCGAGRDLIKSDRRDVLKGCERPQ